MADNDKLPPRARAKIFALVDQEQQASTLTHSTLRQIGELRRSLNTTAETQHMAINKEIARLEPLREKHADRHKHLADINGRVRRFLDMLSADAALVDAPPIKVKLKPGETHQQAVANLRIGIVKLLGERSQVERAALPVDEIKAQLRKWITERGISARPAIVATHDRFDVRYSFMDPEAFTAALDPLALLAWFDPEHLETKLSDLIDQMPKPKFALTPAAKAERLASLKVELDEAVRLECALIEAAQDIGTILDYRPNVDIRCLLAISVSRKKANAA